MLGQQALFFLESFWQQKKHKIVETWSNLRQGNCRGASTAKAVRFSRITPQRLLWWDYDSIFQQGYCWTKNIEIAFFLKYNETTRVARAGQTTSQVLCHTGVRFLVHFTSNLIWPGAILKLDLARGGRSNHRRIPKCQYLSSLIWTVVWQGGKNTAGTTPVFGQNAPKRYAEVSWEVRVLQRRQHFCFCRAPNLWRKTS